MRTRLTTVLGIAALAALAVLTTACASTGAVPRPFPTPGSSGSKGSTGSTGSQGQRGSLRSEGSEGSEGSQGSPGLDGSALVGTALSLRGVPYRNGGGDLHGFDCSGFTQYVFAQHGVGLPREVRDQFEVGIPVQPGDLHAGDLLFFSTTAPGATHVGIAIGADRFVHAPSSAGVVRVERVSAGYWSARWLGARRVS